MPAPYTVGRIVYVEMLDEAKRDSKVRPAMILAEEDEEYPDTVSVVAITTTFDPKRLRPGEFVLPYSRHSHSVTRLKELSCLVSDWRQEVAISDIQGHAGFVPNDIQAQVRLYLNLEE